MIKTIKYISVGDCMYCSALKETIRDFLADWNTEVHISWELWSRDEADFRAKCDALKAQEEVAAKGHATFPFVWINDTFVGGFAEADRHLRTALLTQDLD